MGDLGAKLLQQLTSNHEDAAQLAEALSLAGEAEEEQNGKKQTQSQALVALAAGMELFHAPGGDCYAVIPVAGHRETWPIKTKSFRRWLVRKFYEQEGKPPGAQALQDALGVLEAKAQFDGPESPVFIRLAEKDGAIYLDLANEVWQAVEVTTASWRVVDNPPVKFRRTRGMLPLPIPEPGGSIDELRTFVNVDETGWRLLVAWLLAALRPAGPYPVLLLQGEQGTAKSTTAKVLREMVDPATSPLRTMPRDERDLMISANNNWALTFDNLSGVPGWLSDAFCRLATGGGFATRELYSDAEEILFDAMRPVSLNGIDDLASRHDLLDRSLILNLPQIPDDKRRDIKTFWHDFEQARPRMLGALLDIVAAGLRNIDSVKLDRLPRMADFAKWVTACEPALPWPAGGFMEAYTGNRTEAVELALEADPVAVAVAALLSKEAAWQGTASELLLALTRLVPEQTQKTKAWPKTAKSLGNRLRRAATFLRQTGVEVEFYREGKNRVRTVSIKKNIPANACPPCPQRPPNPETVRTQDFFGGQAGGQGINNVCQTSAPKPLWDNAADKADVADDDLQTFSNEVEVF